MFVFPYLLPALLALFFLLFPPPSRAEELIYDEPDGQIILLDSSCTHKPALDRFPHLEPAEFFNARASVLGNSFTPCYRITGGYIHLIYDDGDQGLIRIQSFKPRSKSNT